MRATFFSAADAVMIDRVRNKFGVTGRPFRDRSLCAVLLTGTAAAVCLLWGAPVSADTTITGEQTITDVNALGTDDIILSDGSHLIVQASGLLGGRVEFNDNITATLSTTGGLAVRLAVVGAGANLIFGTSSNTGTITLMSATSVSISPGASSITIDGGTVAVGGGSVANAFNSANAITVTAGATLDLGVYSEISLSNIGGGGLIGGAIGNLQILGGSFSGTIFNASTLTFSDTTTWSGTGTQVDNIIVNSGASLSLSGGNIFEDTTALQVDGGLNLTDSETTGALSGDGTIDVASGQTLTSGADNASSTWSGTIQGDGGFTKTGTGTLTFDGENYYEGTTTISAGTLVISGGVALADASDLVVNSGATLQVNSAENIGSLSGSGSVFLNGASVAVGANGTSSSFAGSVSGTGALVKQGNGMLTLSGTNTNAGGVNVIGGSVTLTGGSAVADTAGLTLDGGTASLLSSETIGSLTGSSGININANTLTVAGSVSTTYSGAVSGSGTLSKTGTSTLTLGGNSSGFTGSSSVTGGVLAVNGTLGGDVTVGSGGTLGGSGSISGTVTIDGTLSAGNSPGTLTVGTLVLNSGSVSEFELGQPGVVGGTDNDLVIVTGDLTLAGTLDLNSPVSAGYYRLFTYGGTLTGSFDTVTGTGAYTAAVYDTIAGQVNVAVLGSGQQMQFWDGVDATGDGTAGGGAGTWSDTGSNWTGAPGEAEVNAGWVSSVAVFAGTTGGAIIVDGAKSFDTLQFSTNGYILVGDDLQIGVTTGTLNVDSGIRVTIDTIITDGAGSALQKAGAGTLVLTADSTYTGGTVIAAGTLQLGDGSITGWISGDVTNNGALAFNRSDDVNFAGDISGTGSVEQSGSGTLVLSGENTYSGGTIISGGGIEATLASIGSGAITNDGSLLLDVATDGVLSNAMSGSGVFTKTGAGSLSLTGTLTYTGTTTVEAGTLRVNTDLSTSTVVVESGAVLGGSGTIGGFSLASGATLAPGNSIGTLTVAGDGVFLTGSTYEVEVNAAGQSDLLTATGEIAIQSGVTLSILAEPGSYAASTSYTILSAANGIVGFNFATVTSSLAFLDASLTYNPNTVELTLSRNLTGLVDVAETPGQRAVAPAIDELGSGNEILNSIIPLTVSEARDAFSQLSGELYPTVASRLVQDSGLVRDAAMKRLRGTFAALDAPRGGGAEVWGEAYGGWGWQDNGSDYAVARRSAGGVLAGADMPFGSTGVAGVFAGYGSSYVDVASQNANASANSYHAGAYGGYGWGGVSLRGGTAVTWHDLTTSRSISYRGFSDKVTASPDALTGQVFGELAYGVKVQDVAVEAYSGLAYVHQRNGSFRETGGAAALSGTSDSSDTGFLSLGLRARHQFDLAGIAVTAHGVAAWTHALGDVSSNRTLAFAGGEGFSMPGLAVLRNAGTVETGLEMALAPSASLGIAYRVQAAEEALDQSFKGNLRIRF
jgi:outer membrane autotransporter protein